MEEEEARVRCWTVRAERVRRRKPCALIIALPTRSKPPKSQPVCATAKGRPRVPAPIILFERTATHDHIAAWFVVVVVVGRRSGEGCRRGTPPLLPFSSLSGGASLSSLSLSCVGFASTWSSGPPLRPVLRKGFCASSSLSACLWLGGGLSMSGGEGARRL